MGAFEATLKYAQERLQFTASRSLPDGTDLLAKMLANVTACQCLMVRLAQIDDEASLATITALAKAFCTAKSRNRGWGRELLGGNGIVADYNVGRFFADAGHSIHTKARIRWNLIVVKPLPVLAPSCDEQAGGLPIPATAGSALIQFNRRCDNGSEEAGSALANVLYAIRAASPTSPSIARRSSMR
jgi:hypothetical protein